MGLSLFTVISIHSIQKKDNKLHETQKQDERWHMIQDSKDVNRVLISKKIWKKVFERKKLIDTPCESNINTILLLLMNFQII